MAHLEPLETDTDFFSESFEIDCPICGKSIEIPLDLEEDFIVCPHCESKIEIELS